jgi:hypothetical protein
MYRHVFVTLLLLGFARSAPAQMVNPRTLAADSVRPARTADTTGFTAGFDGWPADFYCGTRSGWRRRRGGRGARCIAWRRQRRWLNRR